MRRWLVAIVATSSTQALAQPVTNGLPATGDPAVVALVDEADRVICTASLIAPHTLLTAAHCVTGDPLMLRAFFGSVIADGGTFVDVTHARSHPQWNPGGNDIALLTLAEVAEATPLALAPPLDASVVGGSLRVVGFGTIGQLGGSGTKRLGTAEIAVLRAEELVVVPDLSLSCHGDSGGPGLLTGDAIAGVVSRVDALCVDHAVYTRVDVFRDAFIAPYLEETAEGTAGEGEPCFYAEHCAAGLECRGDGDAADEKVCASSGGCASGRAGGAAMIVLVLAFAFRRRRR
jgi:secreted trypsin-like serine protease